MTLLISYKMYISVQIVSIQSISYVNLNSSYLFLSLFSFNHLYIAVIFI